jgi:hypothetical protein
VYYYDLGVSEPERSSGGGVVVVVVAVGVVEGLLLDVICHDG